MDLEDPKASSTEMALRVQELVAPLVAKRPLQKLVDEAQEHARTKEAELIATALRTAITKQRDHMRVVFTISSRSLMAHMGSASSEQATGLPQLNDSMGKLDGTTQKTPRWLSNRLRLPRACERTQRTSHKQ